LDTAVRAAITRVVLATPRWWEKEGIPPPSFASRAEILAQPHVFSFALVYQVGEYRRAVEAAEDLAERQVTRGAFALAALELENAARALIAVGEVGRAEERHARAFALADRIGAPAFVTAQLLGSIFERARLRGEGYAELFASTQVLRDDPGLENRWLRAAIMAATAYGAAELGQPELALAQIEQVMPAIEQRTGQMNNYTFIVFWTSAALWELGEPRFADRIEPNLLEKTIKPDFRYVSTDARLAMAWLCALQGRPDEAREWFAKARVVLGEQGARPLRAITDFEEARMHARLGSRGDRARGLALLDAADPEFAAIGMPGWLRRSQELRQLLDRT
jgi:tetratricopeptide (TPR) repeat protein